MAQFTKVADLHEHPACKSNDWPLQPTSSGYASINTTSHRSGGPFSLYYEIHGHGPTKLVLIMGLGAYYTAWKRQTKYFAHSTQERKDKYSLLVFDNRGIGKSGKPTSRYSTTEMAMDVLELLVHVGWLLPSEVMTTPLSNEMNSRTTKSNETSGKRDLVIAGVSMGGMIAQEVSLLLPPQRVQSLFLISTAPRLIRTVPFLENLRQRINMFIPRDIDIQIQDVAYRLFSESFLTSADKDPEIHADLVQQGFESNYDRFAAAEIAKRQDTEGFTRKGFMLQAIAAGWHHKSPAQIKEVGDRVGRDRICVMHGTEDRMLTFVHFEAIKEDLGEGPDYAVWNGAGHVLGWEVEKKFNERMEAFIEKAGHSG